MKGESHVLGIPIPKTLVIWAFPSHTTLAIWVKFIQGMPTSLGFWEWGCPKRGDAHITGTPPPFLSPVSSRLIFMFALFPRGSEPGKGPDEYPTRLTTHRLPTNTRHFDFLSPDRSPNNPRWRQSRNQSR